MNHVAHNKPVADSALRRKIMAATEKCLDMDRRMIDRVEASQGFDPASRDPDDFLDPAVWEHYVEARQDLVDFTTSSIQVLARNRSRSNGADLPSEESDIERRLVSSLSEMAALEERLAAYLTENLEVLRMAVADLTRNQTLFSKYSKTGAKPEPGHLDSQA